MLHRLRVLADAGRRVAPRTLKERGLGLGAPGGVACPRLERGGDERATVGERQLPWRAADCVYGAPVRRRALVALTAGEEGDSGHRRGHDAAEACERPLRDLLDAGLLRAVVAREEHVGL